MPGSVYKRGEIYWIKFYYRGKKHEKSAKTAEKREAQDLLAFYMGQVVRGEFKGFEEDTLLMNELFIVDEQDIGLALTQAEAHRKRSSHNPATSDKISKE